MAERGASANISPQSTSRIWQIRHSVRVGWAEGMMATAIGAPGRLTEGRA
ncbi:MAG: hypothetical protein K8J09_10655 [Planctomycetes bacterium]|nr:hypothetical protein [Planctomycetota bacterium]MCC7395473.1 hypothetical protein [Planctomycetota bacterium]